MMRESKGNVAIITAVLIAVMMLILVFQLFLQAPEEIFWEKTVTEVSEGIDLAVVGGSAAALMVALEAAENGANVNLFPHGQDLGKDCFFLVKEGLAAIGTPPQKEVNLELTASEFKNLIQQQGGDISNPLLLNYFVNEAEYFYFRVEKKGGVSFDSLPLPERKPYLHFSSSPEPASSFKEKLLSDLERLGVIFRNETVKEINFSPQERVESLLIEDRKGKLSTLFLQGVILADGGYSADITRWHDFFPKGDNYIQLRPSQKGFGLQLAADQGADIIQTEFLNKRIALYFPQEEAHLSLPEWALEEALLVNTEGEILNGNQFETDRFFSFVLNSPADEVYIIVPEETALALEAPDFFSTFEELENMVETYSLAGPGELQERGVPVSPYYIAPVKGGVDYTLGGVAVTPFGEVIKGEKVLRGLYAAGEIAGGLHGEALLPGMALSEALFLSWTAGKASAEYVSH